MQELRSYIRKILISSLLEGRLSGIEVEDKITVPELLGWEATYSPNLHHQFAYKIFNDQGKRVGIIGTYGLLYYEKDNGVIESDHSFPVVVTNADSIRKAMRYVFIKTQKPLSPPEPPHPRWIRS